MAAENSSKKNLLHRNNAQFVLERAQEERAKTMANLVDARAQMDCARDELDAIASDASIKARKIALDAAIEKVTRLESKLAVASEELRQAQEAQESAETAELMARNAHKAARRSHKAASMMGLEKKLAKARDEFNAARRVIRFAGGDAKRAADVIERAESELKSAREAYEAANANLRTAQVEMDEAISQYLNNKNAETERRYDVAIVARSDAENAVKRTKSRFEEATARNEEAQKSAHLVKDAVTAQKTFEKKKLAFDEATKALNRAISAQKLADNKVRTTEANLEAKISEQEAADRAVDAQSTVIADTLDALKDARKELAAAKNAWDKIEDARVAGNSAVSDAQERVDSLSARLAKLDEIIVDAKSLIEDQGGQKKT